MQDWIWPILIAASQGVLAYGLTFVNKLVQLVAHTFEAHIELLIQREESSTVKGPPDKADVHSAQL
ncbi:hypothetical protein AAC03nite_01570 [Alicyclobacillus acidoterrestris]|uniref:hypothetical protein n=1 Tax=Alicyclobacillus suci TaxID=2816080 RepID=UPI001196F9D5|nr:hypothetical protein [Alicyclobacillus suci]GEO24372.1 hypothetical protein AAC03nite_01570 [Alicyclobacillus acidoterrestris]